MSAKHASTTIFVQIVKLEGTILTTRSEKWLRQVQWMMIVANHLRTSKLNKKMIIITCSRRRKAVTAADITMARFFTVRFIF